MKFDTSFQNFAAAFGGNLGKMQYKVWKAQQKAAWHAQKVQMRAQRRAMRPHRGPLHVVFSLCWMLFWIGFITWMITGGPEARQTVVDIALSLAHTVRDFFVGLFDLVQ